MIHLPCPGTATWWPGHSCLNACHTLSLPHRGAVMPAHTPRCHHFCGRGITVSIPAVYQCHHMVGSLVLMQVISQHYYMAAQKRLLVTMSCPSASKWWLRLPCFYDCRVLVPPHDTPGHTSLYIYNISPPYLCLLSTVPYNIPAGRAQCHHLLTYGEINAIIFSRKNQALPCSSVCNYKLSCANCIPHPLSWSIH